MTNVVIPKEFQSRIDEGTLARLREQGVVLENITGYDELPLREPAYGEQVLGEMTDEETIVFVSFYHVTEEMKTLDRQIGGQYLEEIGRDMRQSREDKVYEVEDHLDTEKTAQFFRLQAQASYLKSMLYWSLGERLGCHTHRIGIRSRRRAVKLDRRY